MKGYDADVFGADPAAETGFDADVFTSPAAKTKKLDIANDAISQGARAFAVQGSDALGGLSQHVLNGLGGFVRGAGSIGATLARPFESKAENDQRRRGVDENIASVGAQPDSWMYQGGKLGGEIAGTAGIGGAAAAPLKAISSLSARAGAGAIPMLDSVGAGLSTGGFRVGGMTGIGGFGARVGTGSAVGGLSAGAVNPDGASFGAAMGGVLPPALQMAGKIGGAASGAMEAYSKRLMQSAIMPTVKQLQSGDAATATQVLLERGLNPSRGGVEKLGGMIDGVDNQISSAISGSTAQIDKQRVLQALGATRDKFGTQVAPQADLSAIQAAEDSFLTHPTYSGTTLSVQDAQDLKRGTYQVLAKKYGQLGSADTEAQKALARGLKDEIAAAVPGISELNAEQSRLIVAKKVAERRALMEQNKNPLGLAALAPSPAGLLAFMADKSSLLKALAARGLYSASSAPQGSMGLLGTAAASPLIRGGLLGITSTNP